MKVKFDTGDTWRASCALYSIFDGHGGTHAAQHAAGVVASYIAEHASFWDSPGKAFKGAFDRCDADCMRMMEENVSVCVCGRLCGKHCWAHTTTHHTQPGERKYEAGSCALVVLVRVQVLHIANLGDCRAVLCRNGKAKQLSVDHSPLVRCVCVALRSSMHTLSAL